MIDEYVFRSKYSRFNAQENRRETWGESVSRMFRMHENAYPNAKEEILECKEAMLDKKVTGSQRALQFGGEAIEKKNMRLYNCVSSYADRTRFFGEALWLLLCGCGVGFSVQKHHVAQLNDVVEPSFPEHHIVEDSIEGWANAVDALFQAYLEGEAQPYYDFSQIRPKGSPLRFGGSAPGPEPLISALDKVEEILKSRMFESLRPIDVFDCVMHLADSVLTAGIRRSATIATFSLDDEEMLTAKTGTWYETNPQRGRANISAVITPNSTQESYNELFKSTKEFGEPGTLFLSSTEYTVNPCVEVIMCPTLIKKDGIIVEDYTLDLVDPQNRELYKSQGYTFESGWQACNLSTINASKAETEEEFYDAVKYATMIGTFQSGYTETGYLGEVSRQIIERESLLGVSICGIMDNPEICLNPEILKKGSQIAVETNKKLSDKLGIRYASRICCVKPEGTSAIILNSSSGIHPQHAKKYIRRVNANEDEPVFQKFYEHNPHAVENAIWGADKVIAFALEAPKSAIVKSDLNAIQFLDKAKIVHQNWILPSTDCTRLESATHNVSITVTVKPEEWNSVRNYLWTEKEHFCGVSFLGSSGDYDYDQAPFQEVYTPIEQEAILRNTAPEKRHILKDKLEKAWDLWNNVKLKNCSVDYDGLIELEDLTKPQETIACGGGACMIV